jgi:hypothetical protein
MFGNKIVISKEQYDILKGIVKHSGQQEYDVSYGIVEFGISFLIALSFEKIGGGEANVSVSKMLDKWKANPEMMKFSNAIYEFMSLDNRDKYVRRSFLSMVGVYTMNIASEQKGCIRSAGDFAGISERHSSYYTFEAGMTFMTLASESDNEKIQAVVNEWMDDADVIKLADKHRKSWQVAKNEMSGENKSTN